jgi:hypothetical protein
VLKSGLVLFREGLSSLSYTKMVRYVANLK